MSARRQTLLLESASRANWRRTLLATRAEPAPRREPAVPTDRAERDTRLAHRMTAQLLADAQRVLRSFAGGSAAQLAQRSLAQQVAHRLLELKARWRHTRRKQAGSALGQLALRRLA